MVGYIIYNNRCLFIACTVLDIQIILSARTIQVKVQQFKNLLAGLLIIVSKQKIIVNPLKKVLF